jgi:phosphohistidine phosphatase
MGRNDARELLLLRHAKSSWKSSGKDFDRPLTGRGRRDAPRIARWMKEKALVPDCVVSSPAARARETTELVLEELGLSPDDVRWDERVYEASTASLLRVLADCPASARRVLLVGHNPGLEDLVRQLGGATVREPDEGKFLPAGALAELRVDAAWPELGAGKATLAQVVRPRLLAENGD